jgi:hypothetical protein
MNQSTDESLETYAEWLQDAETYRTQNGYKMAVKDGDIIEFLFLRWDEHWEFDFPCIMAAPVFQYSPNGDDPESWIEDIAVDLGSMGTTHDEGDDFAEAEWRNWPSAKRFKAIIKERLRGKKTWVKWDAIAHRFLVQFTWNEEDGWLDFKILEHQQA